MHMMVSGHDKLGHRGQYATHALLAERFFWLGMEQDVTWFVKSCHVCQERQRQLVRIPPVETFTPSIFQVLHADTMNMTPMSNQRKYIVHGRCALSSWMEARALREEKGASIEGREGRGIGQLKPIAKERRSGVDTLGVHLGNSEGDAQFLRATGLIVLEESLH